MNLNYQVQPSNPNFRQNPVELRWPQTSVSPSGTSGTSRRSGTSIKNGEASDNLDPDLDQDPDKNPDQGWDELSTDELWLVIDGIKVKLKLCQAKTIN